MSTIAIFHSVLGVHQGILDAAELLKEAGHDVHVIDQYNGRVFDDYTEASSFAESIGYEAYMRSALEAVKDLPDGFICVGFSNGGGVSEYIALNRRVAGVVLCSGVMPLEMLHGVFPAAGFLEKGWPQDTPVQIHYAKDDPFRFRGAVEAFSAHVKEQQGTVEFYEYHGTGHLFTDRSLVNEYNETNTRELWNHVLRFCSDIS